ncbi:MULTISPECIES: hypothetical protein [unclassified Pseudodesulfovibrio]|uniref:hypothetical protein n=1 Tax=unclassified Pseudodesulfovibrio TaxID=2661612 RepID=UPI000FEBDFBE|nr:MULTISPECIES: hypothetical protein [unclassified Pseudodesulfovibrio]MCJ2165812.1 hypothetical protein [Pseudodesulfovibrio sp. S3-i]RWU02756.1 hypothetical protein DWB63_14560 [Pseudodesulfovibrio sp. S3]
MTDASSKGGRPDKAQRLTTYQTRLRALKERSSLREVMERELLLEILHMNSSAINEFPMIEAQQNSVAELLCGRTGHPCCEYLHQHVANFSVLLAHYEKAVASGDAENSADLQVSLLNIEAVLIKCVQGIVYTMALITDNFEELVLRYFGQEALGQYSGLIEKHPLDQHFWKAFVEEFIASRVAEAHREILEGEKYNITKERTFLVIRFLFDDILSKLNPTDAEISKTRIQKGFIAGRTLPEGRKRAKFIQAMLVKGLSSLSQFQKLTAGELLQAAIVSCIDSVSEELETQYQGRQEKARAAKENPGGAAKDPAAVKQEQAQFKFLMDQVVGLGVGAAIAIGVTSDHFYKALESFVPDQIKGILPLRKDFSIPVLEKILYFLLENHTIQILKECGREEGSKIQVRSGRARRVPESAVDGLPGMSKIRKKQLFGNDVTREETLLFKPKTAQQMAQTMSMLSLEKELQQALSDLWKQAVFRVDIMVLINLELVAKTTTNVTVKLSEILEKYGITRAA